MLWRVELSYSSLIEIFTGRIEPVRCAKYILSLQSPEYVKTYLADKHRVVFPEGDKIKTEKWNSYPHVKGISNIVPVKNTDLEDNVFLTTHADRLSSDISRFTQFFSAFTKADDDIKPIMLHYALIYLFDFFSRTWLNYGQNWKHGIRVTQFSQTSSALDTEIKIQVNGVFPRIVDAFYFLNQSSLFSRDDSSGISYTISPLTGKTASKMLEKLKYDSEPKIRLRQLLDTYESLSKIVGSVFTSNHVLVGYAILFIMSSLCRYRAKEWSSVQNNKDLKNKFDLLQYDFVYQWIPEILLQYFVDRAGQKNIDNWNTLDRSVE